MFHSDQVAIKYTPTASSCGFLVAHATIRHRLFWSNSKRICTIVKMATATSHNKKSSAVKRILSEARELAQDHSDLYTAAPLEDNIFEWHFTLRGPANTEFASGLYHGRILLPAEYPMRPPNLMLLTPNGRWELNKKICLTFTGFHEEMWQPAWGIRTALLGLQTFMTAKAEAAVGIGALDYPVQAREKLAAESRGWKCDVCDKTTLEMLPDPDPEQSAKQQEALPEGLHVDLSAESRKSQAPASANTSTPNPPRSDLASAASGVPFSQPEVVSTSPASVRPNPVAASLPAVAPATSLQPQQRRLSDPSYTPAVPPRASSSLPSPPTSASAPPMQSSSTNRAVSATEQRLALIDNCIKALSILVALLVVKRII